MRVDYCIGRPVKSDPHLSHGPSGRNLSEAPAPCRSFQQLGYVELPWTPDSAGGNSVMRAADELCQLLKFLLPLRQLHRVNHATKQSTHCEIQNYSSQVNQPAARLPILFP